MRYGVTGNLPSAFLPPNAATVERAFGGLSHVTGSPGTTAIPAPRPESLWAPTPSQAPQLQPSTAGPAAWRPTFYVASMENQGPSVRTGVDNRLEMSPLPRPSVVIGRKIPVSQRRARVGSNKVTAAIRPRPVWPTYGGGSGSGC